jgi:hypothetical protein
LIIWSMHLDFLARILASVAGCIDPCLCCVLLWLTKCVDGVLWPYSQLNVRSLPCKLSHRDIHRMLCTSDIFKARFISLYRAPMVPFCWHICYLAHEPETSAGSFMLTCSWSGYMNYRNWGSSQATWRALPGYWYGQKA